MSDAKQISPNTFSPTAQGVTGNILNRTKGDKVIWAIVIMLTMVSILVVYSSIGSLAYKMNKSTESYLFKQIGFIALGVLIIYFAHRVNYTIYSRVATILFLISIPLLFYTLKFGSSINEANRWIKLPVINLTFQTSDLAKLALFMYMSRQLSRCQNANSRKLQFTAKVGEVVSNHCFGARRHREFEHMVIPFIRQIWTPEEVNLDPSALRDEAFE